MVDYAEITDKICATIAKVAKPLTQTQRIALAGALAVWMEKAIASTRAKRIERCRHGVAVLNHCKLCDY